MFNVYEDPHAAQWDLPEVKDLPEVQNAAPLELETLPEQIRGAVRDVSERQQSPIDFVAVSALCALSGVIGRRAQIHPKQKDDWLVTPNLWGALIGGPSSMKSPAMAEMTKPLERLEASYSDSHKAALIEHGADKKAAGLRADTADKEAKKLIQQGNDAEAKRVLMAASDGELVTPQKRRFTTGDVTPEKLGEMLSHNPNGLLVIRDELAGLIARCSTDAGAPERAFLLQCFNGNGRYSVDRIGRGETHIPACCIGVLGGIQPSKLALLVRGAINGSDNDGFIQRFQLAVWPDIKEGFTYLDRAPSYAAMQAYGDLFTELDGTLPTLTPDEGEPLLMRFEPTLAQPVFAEWLTKLQTEMRGKDCDLPEALPAASG